MVDNGWWMSKEKPRVASFSHCMGIRWHDAFGHRHTGFSWFAAQKRLQIDGLDGCGWPLVPLTAFMQQVNRMRIVKMFTYWVHVGMTQAIQISPCTRKFCIVWPWKVIMDDLEAYYGHTMNHMIDDLELL